jgi:hypothetical protein
MPEKNITGRVEVGDEVRTLHLKRAIYGTVKEIKKRVWARVEGTHYPGGPEQHIVAHVENLAITKKDLSKLWQT